MNLPRDYDDWRLAGPDDHTPDMEECVACGGDGKETCDNPDHAFIGAMGGDIGRIGCPCCGHDPDHKVPNGGDCLDCGGSGEVPAQRDEPDGDYLRDLRDDR